MNKKLMITTSLTTAIVVFVLTSVFYLSPVGSLLFFKAYDEVSDTNFANYTVADNLIEKNFMGTYNQNQLWDKAMHMYVESLGDAYSGYLNASEYEKLTTNLSGSYQGIGITVYASNGKILISKVKEGYPAYRAGIKEGDFLYKINGVEYNSETLADAVNKIKDVKAGNSVEITVIRDGKEFVFDVKIESINLDYVQGRMLEDSVGYIRIDSFGKDIAGDFAACLEELDGLKGLIIDVRSNPGGSLDSVVDVADCLLREGKIVTVRDKHGNEDVYMAGEGGLDVPMCVLVDEESASASEVLAGALKDHGKAVLVGEKTFGKGVVQSIYKLSKGEALRITTAKYYTPSDVCIDGIGIYPDKEVALPEGVSYGELEEMPENDTQLLAAIDAVKSMIAE